MCLDSSRFAKPQNAFTLIELLVVIGIIAILSLIALPNFLDAQTRAKIARAMADMRSIDVGMEAYHTDANMYPIDYDEEWGKPGDPLNDFDTWKALTTPIAYLSTVFYAPYEFTNKHHNPYSPQEVYAYWGPSSRNNHRFSTENEAENVYFVMDCAGPDRDLDFDEGNADGRVTELIQRTAIGQDYLYDPTNGTLSSGDIIMTHRGFEK